MRVDPKRYKKRDDYRFDRFGNDTELNEDLYEVHRYIRSKKLQNDLDEMMKEEAIANMQKKGYSEAQIREHLDKYYPDR